MRRAHVLSARTVVDVSSRVWAVVLGLAMCAAGVAVWLARAPSLVSPDVAAAALPGCYTQAEAVTCAVQVLEQVGAGDLPDAISLAALRVQDDMDVDCHSVLHVFGEAAARLHGVDSLVPGGSSCSGGYYHGVMMSIGFDNIPLGQCETLTGEDRVACWHGVGHMAVTSGKFEPVWASSACASAPDERAQDMCVEGIAMEHIGQGMYEAGRGNSMDPALDATLAMCGVLDSRWYARCAWQTYNQVATQDPDAVAQRCALETPAVAVDCREAVGAALGGAYQPADMAPAKALELCQGESACLERAVLVAFESRPSSKVGEKLCARVPELSSCRGSVP